LESKPASNFFNCGITGQIYLELMGFLLNDLDNFFPVEICQMVDARQDSSLHIYVDLEISCDCCSALV
jgi:hypothetical protein